MPLTPEEATTINTALAAGTQISEIELLKPLGDNVVIRTTDQEKKFKEDLSKHIETETIGPRISELHSQYDKDIFEATGLKKASDQKTYDHLKSVLKNYKTVSDNHEKEVSDLKAKIEGDGAGLLKSENEALKSKYDTDIATKDNEIIKMQQSHLKLSKQRVVDQAYRKIQPEFIGELPGYFASHKDAVLADLVANSNLTQDGNGIELLNSEGKPLIAANYQPITIESYLKEQFKEVIKQGDGSGGAGGGGGKKPTDPPAGGGEGEKEWEKIERPENIKNQVELRDWLIETYGKTLEKNDRIKAFNKLAEGIPLR